MKTSGFTPGEMKEFIKAQVFAGLGAIAAGLGLYGLFGGGASLHPLLGERGFNIALLGVAGLFLVSEWYILWPVLKARQQRLNRSRQPGNP